MFLKRQTARIIQIETDKNKDTNIRQLIHTLADRLERNTDEDRDRERKRNRKTNTEAVPAGSDKAL